MARKKASIALPHTPAEYTDEIIHAFKALSDGKADETQQKLALDWIIRDCTRSYDLEYRPYNDEGGRGASDFAGGKRFIGLQIVKLINFRFNGINNKDGQDG